MVILGPTLETIQGSACANSSFYTTSIPMFLFADVN